MDVIAAVPATRLDDVPRPPEPGWLALFNRSAFHALNLQPGQRALRFDHVRDGRLVGALAGVLGADGTFVSGHSAPFGGIDLARDHLPPDHAAALIAGVTGQARAAGARAIRIRCKPGCWSPAEETLLFALLNHGFTVERAELNQHIDLAGVLAIDDYRAALRSPARRALKHLLADPEFEFAELADDEGWDAAYALLGRNRAGKGRKLALSAEYLARARACFPGEIRMFGLQHGGRLCAAALVYRVTASRELVVAWGDDGHGLERSPMNLLAERTVARALSESVVLLDLGISNEHEPGPEGGLLANAGLAQFKRSVLAREGVRLTLAREL